MEKYCLTVPPTYLRITRFCDGKCKADRTVLNMNRCCFWNSSEVICRFMFWVFTQFLRKFVRQSCHETKVCSSTVDHILQTANWKPCILRLLCSIMKVIQFVDLIQGVFFSHVCQNESLSTFVWCHKTTFKLYATVS